MADNSKKTAKPRGRPWKPGQSGNPAGRPKDGESWADIIKIVGHMYPNELITIIGTSSVLGQQLAKLPQNVQMKFLVTTRVFASLMFEPSGSLWKELMERADGKVTDKLEVTESGHLDIGVKLVDYRNGVATAEAGSSGDSGASGQDEDPGDGA